ncbi:MAG TPA: hypothetical protein VGS57_05980 [Thermoanaerobaculia bacterium]|nr:hypothetical protein [Thermoanaerobaculia bacterium]
MRPDRDPLVAGRETAGTAREPVATPTEPASTFHDRRLRQPRSALGGYARARELGALALSLAAAWALPRVLGLPDGDPLRGTVAIVPPIVAGLFVVAASARRGGARAPRRWIIAAQAMALVAWLLLAAARARLDLPLAPALAAGLFALLGAHLLELLPRMRPLLGAALPARPHFAFFALPLLAYLAILPWSTSQRPPDGDEPYYLLVTHSLAYDFDADLANNYAAGDSLRFLPRRLEPQPGDPVGQHGELYSRHNVVLPLLLALPYRIAGAAGACAAMAALTAALAWLTLRLARHRFAASPGGAMLAWALLAFAPPLLLYSHQVWVEVPAALLIVLALDALRKLESDRRAVVLFWTMVVLLPLLKLRFAAFAGLLTLLAWWRSGRQQRGLVERVRGLAAAAAGMVALFAAILAFNHARFGAALKTYGLEQLLPEAGWQVVLARALGLFFDVGFGLFTTAPLWMLLIPAVLLLARRRPALAAELAFLVVPYLMLVSFRREWYGGWSPPFRYGLAVLPLLALPLAPLLDERRRGGARVLVAALGAATAALTLVWLAVPGWTYNLADGGSYVLAGLGHELRLDVARLFPSAIRLRAATWWWPLAALAVTAALWRWPRRPLAGTAAAIGVALAIAAPAGAVLLAARLPTAVVELEDAQVETVGGSLQPPLWTFDRPRFHGAWRLDPGSRVEAPVVPGGRRVSLRLWCETPPGGAAAQLQIGAAGVEPFVVSLPAGMPWHRVEVSPLDWPDSPERAPLTLALPPDSGPVLVDRVELHWR